ncbi:MAG: Lipopolysaccharide assembly protein B [Ignavibacteria bacterium]|nr:Lipopolysaccharide assembly protein B [Ignavibacteria bacterium]
MRITLKNLLALTCALIAFSYSYSQDSFEKGINAAKNGDYVTAVNLLKSTVNSEDSYEGFYYYGLALLNTGSIKQAENEFQKALKKDSEGIGALKGMGDLYSKKKDYTKADSYYDKAIKVEPENLDLMLAKAKNLTVAGKIDDALNVLALAKTVGSESPEIYVGLGDAYYYRRAFKPAEENYQKALKLKSGNAKAFYGLGMIAFREREFNNALDYFNKAITSNPNFADAYLEKGRLLYFNENYDEALKTFEKYAQLQPGSVDGLTYIAKVKYGQKKYDEALSDLEKIIKENPDADLSSAYKYMAYVYNEKEEYEKAKEYFSKVPKDLFDIEDHIKLAQIYSNTNEFSKSYAEFDEAIKQDSTVPYIYYQMGIVQFNEKKYSDAIINFQKAIDMGTTQLAAYVYKGLSLYSLQKYDQSLAEFNIAISKDDKYVPAWLWRARSEVQLDKFEDAKISYKKVLELEPDNKSAREDLDIIEKKQ